MRASPRELLACELCLALDFFRHRFRYGNRHFDPPGREPQFRPSRTDLLFDVIDALCFQAIGDGEVEHALAVEKAASGDFKGLALKTAPAFEDLERRGVEGHRMSLSTPSMMAR